MTEKNHSTDTDNKTAEKKPAEKKPAVKHVKRASSSQAGIYITVFFVVLATMGGFYLLWENQQQTVIKAQLATQTFEQQIETLQKQQRDFSVKNTEQIQEITTQQENLRANLTNLVRDNQHLRNDWLMAEAEYLIQVANHRLLLEKDVNTAIVALKAADARLAEVADPGLLQLRKILARDLQSLNNVSRIDLAGLSVTLSAMSNNIPNLPLRTPDPKTHKQNQAKNSAASSSVNNLKELPAAIWKDIKNLIVIRNHQKPLEPLLAPEQHYFLLQNLALMIEQARLALLNGHNTIFQERLKTTENWINLYFDTDHNVTRNMLANLGELQKFDIDPPLPDISSTFSAVKKYRTQGQKNSTPDAKVNK